MWIPKSADEIEQAVQAKNVEEGPTFDAKKELPAQGKNKDIAKDVAAMANDSGVLVYGIDEDEHGRATVLTPILLNGAAERIANVVHTAISESPQIETFRYAKQADPSRGYLVVVVPASPCAPHMVTLEKDCRYYKRLDKISVPMNEGEVARLYERRQRWEVDRTKLLQQAIERNRRLWPVLGDLPSRQEGALHMVLRPLASANPDLLHTALGDREQQQFLQELVTRSRQAGIFSRIYRPDLTGQGGWERRDGGWRLESVAGVFPHRYIADLTLTGSGQAYLYCNHAAELGIGETYKILMQDVVAGLTTRTLVIAGGVYEAAHYVGPVDVGVAVTGLAPYPIYAEDAEHGATVLSRTEDYMRTTRVLAYDLVAQPREVARSLVFPLIAQIAPGRSDPW
jgi:hypothetical protein